MLVILFIFDIIINMREGIYIPKPQTHLDPSIPGAKPIVACLISRNNYTGDAAFDGGMDQEAEKIKEKFEAALGEAHDVKYGAYQENLAKEKFSQTEGAQCVISPVDAKDKFSKGFLICTSMIVTGIDKETGKNISFLTHQNPLYFFNESYLEFRADINKRLAEIKARSIPGTIDAVIVGGDYDSKKSNQLYLDSLRLLSELSQQGIGFDPIVINGPKIDKLGQDDIYYNTGERRLYFLRPEAYPNSKDFAASDAEKEKDQWKILKNDKEQSRGHL